MYEDLSNAVANSGYSVLLVDGQITPEMQRRINILRGEYHDETESFNEKLDKLFSKSNK
jgi:hypothetical protein